MSTKLEIVNVGLAHASQSPITALDEESVPASFIETIYGTELKAALADHTWRFAREFVTLNRLASLNARSIPQYQLPGDWVRTVGIEVGGVPTADFDQSRDKLLIEGTTEDSAVSLEYITDNIAETIFPAHFVEAFAMRLGIRFSRSIARNDTLADRLAGEHANLVLPRVRSIDSQQGGTKMLRRSRITSIRKGARR